MLENFLIKKINKSISVKLFLSFLTIISLVVFTYILTLNTLIVSRDAEQKLTKVTFPLLQNTQSLTKLLSDYVLAVNRIPTTSPQEIEKLPIQRLKRQIDKQLLNIAQYTAARNEIGNLRIILDQIDQNSSELNRSYEIEIPDLSNAIEEKKSEVIKVTDSIRAAIQKYRVVETLRTGSLSIIDSTGRLINHIASIRSSIGQYHSSMSINEIRRIQIEFSQATRRVVVGNMEVQNLYTKEHVSKNTTLLLDNTDGTNSFFTKAQELSVLLDNANAVVSQIRLLENELLGQISRIVSDVDKSSSKAFADAERKIDFGIKVIFGFIVLVLTLSTLLIIFFVKPSIINRLNDLTEKTEKIIDGDYSQSIKAKGSDEISRISKALEKFRIALIAKDKLNIELERSNKNLDNFAYVASHDLKEPIRGIAINANFILKEKLPEPIIVRVNRMIELSNRMEKLISDLLFFARLERTVNTKLTSNIGKIVSECETLFEELQNESRAKIVVKGNFPLVYADPSQVRIVIHNLIGNALKYNFSNPKIVEVGFIETLQHEGKLIKNVFFVKDNGIGIAPEFHEKIFSIFTRLNPREMFASGTGAGLSFVKRIVEQCDGAIWLSSKLEASTTFYFTLPTAPAELEQLTKGS